MDNAIKMEAQRLLIAAALVKGSYYPEISPQIRYSGRDSACKDRPLETA
jgi:hypothetical protein